MAGGREWGGGAEEGQAGEHTVCVLCTLVSLCPRFFLSLRTCPDPIPAGGVCLALGHPWVPALLT